MPVSTFYPDANPESTSVDGQTYRGTTGVNETFSTIRGGAGTNEWQSDTATTIEVRLDASTTSNQYQMLGRSFLLFDTSSLPDDAIINSVTLSLYGNGKVTTLGTTGFDVHVAASNPSSNTAIAYTDHSNISRTSFGSLAYASYATGSYNDITLNASGIAAISKTGVTKFSLQSGWDLNNSFGGSWSSGAATLLRFESSDTAVSNAKPKLTIDYTEATTTSTTTSTSTSTTTTSTSTSTSTTTTSTSTSTTTSTSTSTSTSTTTIIESFIPEIYSIQSTEISEKIITTIPSVELIGEE